VTATRLLDLALVVAAVPVAAAAAYLLFLALLSRRTPPPRLGAPRLRFDVVVPAHDEETGIAATVHSLRAVDYPPDLRRIVVVADNCRDATAARAREAGARVIERTDPDRRGKGYALALAFSWSLSDGFADAIAVVDADTVVTGNLLAAFAARLESGAVAVQARYGVRNAGASWRTRLLAIAFALFHDLRSIARERLRCSAGLRGNGMCFGVQLLRDVPHDAFSIVEDVEYGIRLGLAGHRVHFAAEAEVLGEMVPGADASRSQRRRWEGGRLRLARAHLPTLVRRGLSQRDRVLLDLAADLAVPPLAFLGASAVGGLALALVARWAAGGPMAAPWLWGASLVALCLYVARGWWLSSTGLAGLLSLARAPAYLAWKIGLALSRRDPAAREWVRTERSASRTDQADA
jgi:cellulose synthase/poly-beta-1,6-N-acetylglucosamine synthase-like glycosyltransferase